MEEALHLKCSYTEFNTLLCPDPQEQWCQTDLALWASYSGRESQGLIQLSFPLPHSPSPKKHILSRASYDGFWRRVLLLNS